MPHAEDGENHRVALWLLHSLMFGAYMDPYHDLGIHRILAVRSRILPYYDLTQPGQTKMSAVPWVPSAFSGTSNHSFPTTGSQEMVSYGNGCQRSDSDCGCGCGPPRNWFHRRSRVTLGKQHLELELRSVLGVFVSIHKADGDFECRGGSSWHLQSFLRHHLTALPRTQSPGRHTDDKLRTYNQAGIL